MASPEPTVDLAVELEKAGLLRDEYPDQMAARSCTCEPDAVRGAHRLLARYDELFQALQKANQEKREAKKALSDLEALLDVDPSGYPIGRAVAETVRTLLAEIRRLEGVRR